MREIKLATNIKESHVLQAACYALMLGRIQRRTPEYFLVTNGDGATTRYAYGEYEDKLLEYIGLAARIRGGWEPPAAHGSAANTEWSNHCNEVAVRSDDVSLIPKVGPAVRGRLVEAGFATVKDVASSTATALQRVKGVKKTASDILASARHKRPQTRQEGSPHRPARQNHRDISGPRGGRRQHARRHGLPDRHLGQE